MAKNLKTILEEKKKTKDQISAIRTARKKHIDDILAERGAKMNDVAQLAGMKPGKPSLTTADYDIIEQMYNKVIAPLREQLRLLQADEAAARVPGLDDKLDQVKAERDKAAAVLAEHEGKVKAVETEIDIALKTVERAKAPGSRIRFESKLPALEREYNPGRKQKLVSEILNY
ncbi:MAG: hypothetical protein JW807_16620 [Spirochaetes bacterium]|nr:hypothetical protein [Spirochaetota bacterium]